MIAIASATAPLSVEQLRAAEETIGNPESELYDEDAFCKVLAQAVDSPLIGEADRLRATYRLEIAAKNKPGTTAADFLFITREGREQTLLGLNAEKPVVLLFYDPDCGHCMETIAALQASDIPDKTKIVAIYAEDEREHWEETAPQLPADWTVGFALDPIQMDDTYIFITSPTIFLLDTQKTILLKDTTLHAVEQQLSQQ